MKNTNIGSSFDDFLKEEGLLDEVEAAARARVAERFLSAAMPVPRVIRRKDEAQALVDSLSPVEREIIHHIWSNGTVSSSTGNTHVTLSPPLAWGTTKRKKPTKDEHKHIPGGLALAVRLARAGWLRKASQDPDETFFYWYLTTEADKVLRLVEP